MSSPAPAPCEPGPLPASWQAQLGDEVDAPYFRALSAFVAEERARGPVFPPQGEVFAAFELTPFEAVRVVLLGQDPYHDAGQAHGLCFSVREGTRPPPSLKNIFRELEADLGVPPPRSGDLSAWARRGVLLLNSVLTVAAHRPSSHKARGWERFTDAVIARLSARAAPLVFCLWGNYARRKARLVERARHRIVEGAHPSPLSAKKFLGSRPFSAVNAALVELGQEPLDWAVAGETAGG